MSNIAPHVYTYKCCLRFIAKLGAPEIHCVVCNRLIEPEAVKKVHQLINCGEKKSCCSFVFVHYNYQKGKSKAITTHHFCSDVCRSVFERLAKKGTRVDLEKAQQVKNQYTPTRPNLKRSTSVHADIQRTLFDNAADAVALAATGANNAVAMQPEEPLDDESALTAQLLRRLRAGKSIPLVQYAVGLAPPKFHGMPYLGSNICGATTLEQLWRAHAINSHILQVDDPSSGSSDDHDHHNNNNNQSKPDDHDSLMADYVQQIINRAPRPQAVLNIQRARASEDVGWGFSFFAAKSPDADDSSTGTATELVIESVEVASNAFQQGLRRGHVIVAVNGTSCLSQADFHSRIGSLVVFEATVYGCPTIAMRRESARERAQLRLLAAHNAELKVAPPTAPVPFIPPSAKSKLSSWQMQQAMYGYQVRARTVKLMMSSSP